MKLYDSCDGYGIFDQGFLNFCVAFVAGLALIVGYCQWVAAGTTERARAWCADRCEVIDCHANSTCDIRYPGRPAYSMDCRGRACSWP